MKKIIFLIETLLLFLFGIVIICQLFGVSWSDQKFALSCQPQEINYGSSNQYCISIIKQQQTLDTKYFIWIAKQVEPTYGFALNYPFASITSEQDLLDTKTNWTNEGIEIEAYLNTKIFIPKKNFIGGR